MRRARDRRVPALLGALALVTGVALLVERLPAPRAPAAQGAGDTRAQAVGDFFGFGVSMLRAGRNARAAAAFEQVLLLAPRLPEAHANRGFALLGLGHYAAAEAAFATALGLRPGQANAYWGLAVAREARCDRAGASRAMRTYLHLAAAHERFRRRARSALWEWDAGMPGECPDSPGRGRATTDREQG